MSVGRRRDGKGFCLKISEAFLNFDAAVYRQILEGLREAAGPANRRPDLAIGVAHAKEKFLGVLRQESGARLEIFGLAKVTNFNGHSGADRVAITLLSAQAECDGVANLFHGIAQHPQLRRVPVLENDFESPVVVDVGQGERAAVIRKIQGRSARDVRKSAVAVVGVEDISLRTSP